MGVMDCSGVVGDKVYTNRNTLHNDLIALIRHPVHGAGLTQRVGPDSPSARGRAHPARGAGLTQRAGLDSPSAWGRAHPAAGLTQCVGEGW